MRLIIHCVWGFLLRPNSGAYSGLSEWIIPSLFAKTYASKSRSDQRCSRPHTRAEQVNLHQAAADVLSIKE